MPLWIGTPGVYTHSMSWSWRARAFALVLLAATARAAQGPARLSHVNASLTVPAFKAAPLEMFLQPGLPLPLSIVPLGLSAPLAVERAPVRLSLPTPTAATPRFPRRSEENAAAVSLSDGTASALSQLATLFDNESRHSAATAEPAPAARGRRASRPDGKPHFHFDENQKRYLRAAYDLARQGKNKTMRFGAVLVNPRNGRIVGGSWNRLSTAADRKKFNRDDFSGLLPYAESLSERGLLPKKLRKANLDTSVHAEQGAIIEALKTFSPAAIRGFKVYSVGINQEGLIGVRIKRNWTCLRCALWMERWRVIPMDITFKGFEDMTHSEAIDDALSNRIHEKKTGYWADNEKGALREDDELGYHWFKPQELLK